jgi:hypothetical protein
MDAAEPHPAIERIWPTRFEVIINLNLNFRQPVQTEANRDVPEIAHADARRAAKALITKYIKEAKLSADVDDPDQDAEQYKTAGFFEGISGSILKNGLV